MSSGLLPEQIRAMQQAFGERLLQGAPLAPYTSARLGGPAEFLNEARSAGDLAQAAQTLWGLEIPFRVLGGGSNVLVADAGVNGVILLNRARETRLEATPHGPRAWAESGASLGSLARRTVERGWTGMEWAATVPGTVGGAVVGNAGAHNGDTAGSLRTAEILQHGGEEGPWSVERFEYSYRDSWLKQHPGRAVVLAAEFHLDLATVDETRAVMAAFVEHRRRTQPPGASWGSMFKNPHGDFAGRLIEAAGLKGLRAGEAQISPHHANFFLNLGDARAEDAWTLIRTARERVMEQFGVELELEVELLGDWAPELATAGAAS